MLDLKWSTKSYAAEDDDTTEVPSDCGCPHVLMHPVSAQPHRALHSLTHRSNEAALKNAVLANSIWLMRTASAVGSLQRPRTAQRNSVMSRLDALVQGLHLLVCLD